MMEFRTFLATKTALHHARLQEAVFPMQGYGSLLRMVANHFRIFGSCESKTQA